MNGNSEMRDEALLFLMPEERKHLKANLLRFVERVTSDSYTCKFPEEIVVLPEIAKILLEKA